MWASRLPAASRSASRSVSRPRLLPPRPVRHPPTAILTRHLPSAWREMFPPTKRMAENIATITKVPGQHRPRPITISVPDDGQPGPSSGGFNGKRGGKTNERTRGGGGSVPELNPQPGDLLELSAEALDQFKQRARM